MPSVIFMYVRTYKTCSEASVVRTRHVVRRQLYVQDMYWNASCMEICSLQEILTLDPKKYKLMTSHITGHPNTVCVVY